MHDGNPHSSARLMGHPIHPMLVPFPIVFFISALATDIVFLRNGNDIWATASAWLLGAGLATAALAALAGLADFFGAVAELFRLAEQRLLAGRILFEVRLYAEQQVLVNERFHVLVIQRDRLIDRRQPGLHVLYLFGIAQAEIAVRLLPVVGRDRVERLRVVRFAFGPRLQCLDRSVEIPLPVIEGRQRRVNGRFGWSRIAGLDERLLGSLVVAAIFVDAGQSEVVQRVGGIQIYKLLHDRFGLCRIVQFVGTVRVGQILQRQLFELGTLLKFDRFLVVGDRVID